MCCHKEENAVSTQHSLSTRSPSYFASIVYATCSCGWEGPARDFYGNLTGALTRLDGNAHLAESVTVAAR